MNLRLTAAVGAVAFVVSVACVTPPTPTPVAPSAAPAVTVIVVTATPLPTPNLEATVEARVQATVTVLRSALSLVPAAQATKPAPTDERARMEQLLSVQLTGMRVRPRDSQRVQFNDVLELKFSYANKGTVGIRAFTGITTFGDVFGRPIKRVNLTYDKPIAPGQQIADTDKVVELNPFLDEDKRLQTTDYENIKFSFEPTSIILSDGTQIGRVRS